MKTFLLLLTLAVTLSFSALAEEGTWTGVLADADCKAATPDAMCPVDSDTASFGIVVEGEFIPFDAAGNAQIRGERPEGNPTVTVSGDLDGGELKVRELRVS